MFLEDGGRDVKMGDKAARGPPPKYKNKKIQNTNTKNTKYTKNTKIQIQKTQKQILKKLRDVKMGDKAARRSPPACFSIFPLSLPCKKIHIYMNFSIDEIRQSKKYATEM